MSDYGDFFRKAVSTHASEIEAARREEQQRKETAAEQERLRKQAINQSYDRLIAELVKVPEVAANVTFRIVDDLLQVRWREEYTIRSVWYSGSELAYYTREKFPGKYMYDLPHVDDVKHTLGSNLGENVRSVLRLIAKAFAESQKSS